MKMIRNGLIFLVLFFFSFYIINTTPLYASSYKKWALPLLGVSLIAGYGAYYTYGKASDKYDEAENIYNNEYLTIPQGQPNEVFEQSYEKYENKLSEAKTMRTYYLICSAGAVLAFAGSIVLYFFIPSSNESVNVGYNIDYKENTNNLFIKAKF